MRVRLLSTSGEGKFVEHAWEKPEPSPHEIEVKAVMTGVCRSDIAMMKGEFGPLPLEMQGHEGLGIVTKVGMSVLGVNVGDYVATRGEPAYADYYNCRIKEFVVVPELSPKYIIEPVACGVNCVMQAQGEIRSRMPGRALIIGSGFLAWVAYNVLKNEFNKADIDVVGRSNKDLFGDILKDKPEGTYDVVIDLGSGSEIFDTPILNNEALVVFGVEKQVTTNFQQLLWKACTMIFPSPRNTYFNNYMHQARNMVTSGALNVDKFWTKGYNRDTEWQQAFADGLTRPQNYSRGYIYWNQNGN
jgi:threonine dehydrogenase-like Zn-dependent dehydrogenase